MHLPHRAPRYKYKYVCHHIIKSTLGERLREHVRDVKNKSPKLLSVHLNSREHHGTDDISIAVLSFIKQTPNSLSAQKARDRMEMFWYNQLGTKVPGGLNVEKTAKNPTNSSSTSQY